MSKHFLQSYVLSLLAIQQDPKADLVKGKMVVMDEGACQLLLHVKATKPPQSKWKPPRENQAKLNVDGSMSIDGTTGAGMILRGHDGVIIFPACRSLWSYPDALHAELASFMEGLALAYQWTELPIILECNSKVAVEMITSLDQNRSIYAMVIHEVKSLLGERECVVTHIPREQNNVSHMLAYSGRTEDHTIVWIRYGSVNNSSLCTDELLCS